MAGALRPQVLLGGIAEGVQGKDSGSGGGGVGRGLRWWQTLVARWRAGGAAVVSTVGIVAAVAVAVGGGAGGGEAEARQRALGVRTVHPAGTWGR